MGNSKNYTTLVTRLRKAAAEEPVERRQLLLRAASAIDELQKESSKSVKLLDDYASSARVIALYLKQFCDTSLNYPNMIADAARKACEALEKYQKSKQEGRLVVLPCKVVCGDTIWWADAEIHNEPRWQNRIPHPRGSRGGAGRRQA